MSKEKLYGLIGFPLSHSFSKKYFTEKFERENIQGCSYDLFPIENIEELPKLIHSFPNLHGLNVTIPYKEMVFDYLDEIDGVAAAVGAVNTIKIENQKLIGYNSDVPGFRDSLLEFIGTQKIHLIKALVLGTGGASKAVCYVLDQLSIHYLTLSKSNTKGDLTYQELNVEYMASHNLIINTTPLGMSPNTDSCPDIPFSFLSSNHFLFDLVYNPKKTLFLEKGERFGCATKNGWQMLKLQAEKSWEFWNYE